MHAPFFSCCCEPAHVSRKKTQEIRIALTKSLSRLKRSCPFSHTCGQLSRAAYTRCNFLTKSFIYNSHAGPHQIPCTLAKTVIVFLYNSLAQNLVRSQIPGLSARALSHELVILSAIPALRTQNPCQPLYTLAIFFIRASRFLVCRGKIYCVLTGFESSSTTVLCIRLHCLYSRQYSEVLLYANISCFLQGVGEIFI